MKKRTKILIVLIAFLIMAILVIVNLSLPKKEFVVPTQSVSYETFLQYMQDGKVKALYYGKEKMVLYGVLEGSPLAIDHLPKAYDFFVEQVSEDELRRVVDEHLQQEMNGYGFVFGN